MCNPNFDIIDEAYSLCDSHENSFGDEAINTIVQEMENHREDVMVMFAGYRDKMERFLERNPGLTSRVAFQIHFDDYSVEELCDITKLIVSKKKMVITDNALDMLRTYYEKAEMNIAERLLKLNEAEITDEMVSTIEAVDISGVDSNTVCGSKKSMGFVCDR